MRYGWNKDGLRPVAALLLRCAVGLVFLYHGYPKLTHTQDWTRVFVHMGFPGYFAYVAGALEVVGGALLVLGLATRASALLLAGEMAVALFRVDVPSGSLAQVDNYQLSLLLMVSTFALTAFGPGALSTDGVLRRITAHAEQWHFTRPRR